MGTEKGKQMRRIVTVLLWLFMTNTVYAEIYKSKDAEGNVVFSDVQVKGAETVKLPSIITYQSPVLSSKTSTNASPLIQPNHKPYQRLTILEPEQEGTILNNEGEVTIRYSVSPVLQKGDFVQAFLDGELQEGVVLKGLDRGEHTIRVQVVDASGYAHVTSDDVKFYLQRQSVSVIKRQEQAKNKKREVFLKLKKQRQSKQ